MDYGVLSEKIKQEDWNYDHIFVSPNIPQKKLFGAIKSYAKDVRPEEVIILVDDTVFGGAKEGVLATNNAIYSKELFESPKKVQFRANLNMTTGAESRILIDNNIFFKATIIDHHTLLTITSRISSIFKEHKDFSGVKIESQKIMSSANHVEAKSKSEQTGAYESDSIFHSSKRKFLLMLQEQNVSKELIPLTSNLYDISLRMSYLDGDNKYVDNESLSSVLFNDDRIFQTIIYSYYTAKRLLNEHLGEEKSQALLMPLSLTTFFYFAESGVSNSPSTLKSAINPMSTFTESEVVKTFKENVELYFRGYHRNENGIEVARENFEHILWSCLAKKYDAAKTDAISESESQIIVESHSSQKIIELEQAIEATLIKFFNGKL